VINNFGGFYPSWVYLNEARNWGATLHLPCVNNSDYTTCLQGERDLYVGFIHIANLEAQSGKAISEERKANGDFRSLEDFVSRLTISIEQLVILIRVGAFRFTGKPKATLLWEAHMLLGKNQSAVRSPQSADEIGNSKFEIRNSSHVSRLTSHVSPASTLDPPPSTLFETPPRKFELPALWQSQLEEIYDEIELLGWPVTHTWFDLLETSFRGEIMATDMNRFVGKKVRMLGLLVTIKYVRTVKKEWMHFGTFIDVHGQFFDTVHFPQAVSKYPFRGDGIYLALGKIVEEFGFPSLEVEKMAKMPVKSDPRS
ncbi:MAG: hypothetical protein ABIJ04_09790, partial [Bacteroidota bacterium]